MKYLIIFFSVFCFAFCSIKAQDLKLDEILDKFYKVNGFDKLAKVNTIIMSGSITRNDLMPITVTRMRPNKYKMEFSVVDVPVVQSFDGENAWFTAPYTGNPNPQKITGPGINDMKLRADFEGAIYKWKEKGHTVELNGQEKIGNSDAYIIKITRSDGSIELNHIDKQSFYLLKRTVIQKDNNGKDFAVENIFSDFRAVEGIIFPFASENKRGGRPNSMIQYESVEINKTVDAKSFEMPSK